MARDLLRGIFSGKVDDRAARAQGMDGIDRMLSGYTKIAQLSLPPGAALVLASMRKNIMTLETLLDEAALAEPRPWRLPLLDEQDDWAKAVPAGGILLRRQLCMAALDDGEWLMGGLYISDKGVAFDTGSDPDFRVQTGLVPWCSITELQRPGPESEVILCTSRPELPTLHLQLTIPGDVEWIEGFVRLLTGEPDIEASDSEIAEDENHADVAEELANVASKGDWSSRGGSQILCGTAGSVCKKDLTAAPHGPAVPTDAKAHRALSLESGLSMAFAEAPDGRPAFQPPDGHTPVGTWMEPCADIAVISAKLQTDNWLPSFLVSAKEAHSVSATPWTESRRVPGVMVRKATFTTPTSRHFLGAVRKLVNLPTETRVTAMFRLLEQVGHLVFTAQFCWHDLPFGESFRVHETVLFSPEGQGVVVKAWVEVLWLTDSPWTPWLLKSVVEHRARADSLGRQVMVALTSS